MAAAEAKAKADGLFRDRKFTDAIDAYGSAIDLDPSNKALYSNRAACQEKLCATLYGDEKKAKYVGRRTMASTAEGYGAMASLLSRAHREGSGRRSL